MSSPATPPSRPTVSRGLVLFARRSSPGHRRRRLAFAAVAAVVAIGLTVPLVPAVWGNEPGLLGLPTSFVWVLANLLVVFLGLIWLFRNDRNEED